MPTATFHFPRGFLWGSATSAHQVEGQNNNNNWADWESQPGRIMQGGKARLACDWWGGRWREDFDRAAESGQNAHRLSIEWSRVQPQPDRWDEDALDRYRAMVRGLVDRKMTPMVTLHHFSDPLWLYARGSWENDETPALFDAFVRKVVGALKEYVSLWVTINEPNVYTYGGWLGYGFPPGKNDLNLAYTVMGNLVRAHALAYRTIHAIQPQAMVGFAHHYQAFKPANHRSPLDKLVSRQLHLAWNDSFMGALQDGKFRFLNKKRRIPEAVGTQDYIGLNYYTASCVAFILSPSQVFHRRSFPPGARVSETGFLANVPEGFFEALKWARRQRLPIYVTENGVDDSSDDFRRPYMLQHLHQLWRACNFNWEVKGYFHWSLVDNFEWERGWTQRFGLWGLENETQKRIPRPSVDMYQAICRENSISFATVEKFAPELVPILYP